ncbi:MAG: hypothetical protein ACREEM_55150 [Blastocatellia bacterium]
MKNEKAVCDRESQTAQLLIGSINAPIIPAEPNPNNPEESAICVVCGDSLADSVEPIEGDRCPTCVAYRPAPEEGALPFDPEHCSGSFARLLFFPHSRHIETGEVHYEKAA